MSALDEQSTHALTYLTLQSAPDFVKAYLRAVMFAATKAHFALKYVPPDLGQDGCYLMMMPGGTFRAGERSEQPLVSLVSVCNAIRGDLTARGHRLPDPVEIE